MPARTRLDHDRAIARYSSNAGWRYSRHHRYAGSDGSIYVTRDVRPPSPAQWRYLVRCETHTWTAGAQTMREARKALAYPFWCPSCREALQQAGIGPDGKRTWARRIADLEQDVERAHRRLERATTTSQRERAARRLDSARIFLRAMEIAAASDQRDKERE